jgi:hypothetical protein
MLTCKKWEESCPSTLVDESGPQPARALEFARFDLMFEPSRDPERMAEQIDILIAQIDNDVNGDRSNESPLEGIAADESDYDDSGFDD